MPATTRRTKSISPAASSGLTPGSPVRYLGVDVGSVRRITLSKERPDSVAVLAWVDAEAPITGATRASLTLQGITGLLYIDLKQVPDANGSELKQGERFPIIEAQSSDISAFIASLPQLASRVTTLIDKVNTVFSDENVQGPVQHPGQSQDHYRWSATDSRAGADLAGRAEQHLGRYPQHGEQSQWSWPTTCAPTSRTR